MKIIFNSDIHSGQSQHLIKYIYEQKKKHFFFSSGVLFSTMIRSSSKWKHLASGRFRVVIKLPKWRCLTSFRSVETSTCNSLSGLITSSNIMDKRIIVSLINRSKCSLVDRFVIFPSNMIDHQSLNTGRNCGKKNLRNALMFV